MALLPAGRFSLVRAAAVGDLGPSTPAAHPESAAACPPQAEGI